MPTTPKTLFDLTSTTTVTNATDRLVVFGSGYEKDILYTDLLIAVAADFVAAPATYDLATLHTDGKLLASQVRYSGLVFLGTSTVALLPNPNTLSAGEFYVITTGGTLWSNTWTTGEVAVSDGTLYDVGPSPTKQIGEGGTGATTAATARTNLDVMATADVNDRFLDRAPSNAVRLGLNGYAAPAGALSAVALRDEFAILVSFRINALPATQSFLAMLGPGGASTGSSLGSIHMETSGALDFTHYDGSSDALNNVIAAPAEIGKVYSVIYRVDSANDGLTAFVDGVKGSSVATGAGTGASLRWQFGASDSDGSVVEVLSYKVFNEVPSDADCVLFSKRGNVPEGYQWGKADQATNGTFASDVSWTKGAGWTIAAGVASCASGSTDLEQAQFGSAIVGHRYRVTFTVSGFSAGTITPMAGATAGTARSSDATFSEIITFASGTNLIFRSAAFVGNIDNVLLEELGVTDSGQPGNIELTEWADESSNERNLTLTSPATPLMVKPQTSGTFLPGVAFNGGTTGVTYTSQEGFWRKLDEKTWLVYGSFVLSSKGSYTTETATLTGFPESGKNLSRDAQTFAVKVGAMNGLVSSVIGEMDNNSAIATFFETAAGGAATLDAANFANTSEVSFNFVYETE